MDRRADSYHHGDLSRALVEAGFDLARQDGASAIVLREATRRAGVTPKAAYRHFRDRDTLVSAVAAAALGCLAASMDEALVGVARGEARLVAVGLAYIHFAMDEPGLFDVATFSPTDMSTVEDPYASGPSGRSAYHSLVGVIEQLVAEGLIAPADAQGAATMCWASVHGYASLTVKGPLRDWPRVVVDTQAADLVERVVAAVCSRNQ